MKATVFYPVSTPTIEIRNYYDFDGTLVVYNSETGERFSVEPSSEYYTQVGEFEDENADDHWEFLETVWAVFNNFKNDQISERIQNGELQTDHSSMSVGDVVVIDGVGAFITAGIGFDQINFE